MKSKFTLLAAVIILLSLSNISFAQGIKAGGGITYATEISNIGLRAHGIYSLNKKWEVAPAFTYFLEKDGLSWVVVDVNAHYVFTKKDGFTAYGLAGVNMTFFSFDLEIETPDFGGDFGMVIPGLEDALETSGSDFGVNIGGGVRKSISKKLELLGEVKYVLGGAKNLAITAGVVYAF